MSCGRFDQSNCCGGVAMCDSCKEMNVTSEGQSEMLDTYATEVDVCCVLCDQVAAWAFPAAPPSLPAYTLHTSGTTGDPKTIRVPHCCVVPNTVDLRKRFGLCHDDIVFNAAPLTFDPSVVEVSAVEPHKVKDLKRISLSFRSSWPSPLAVHSWLFLKRSKGHPPSWPLFCFTDSMSQCCRQHRHW